MDFNKNSPDGSAIEQLNRLKCEIVERLKENLIGIYVHGSLALGCFNPYSSDVDVLVVTREALTSEKRKQLTLMMLTLSNDPHPIEISFLSIDQLHPWRFPVPYQFHFSEDWRERYESMLVNGRGFEPGDEPVDPDLAAHIKITNHCGICLFGEKIENVFPFVPEKDYISAILYDFDGLDDVLKLNPVYAVLNMCRVVYFLQEGVVSSKEQGGAWALQRIPDTYKAILNSALAVYRGENISFEHTDQIEQFSHYMRKKVDQFISLRNVH